MHFFFSYADIIFIVYYNEPMSILQFRDFRIQLCRSAKAAKHSYSQLLEVTTHPTPPLGGTFSI